RIPVGRGGTTGRCSRSCSAAVPRTSRSAATSRPNETRRRRAPARPSQSGRGVAPDVAYWAASGPGLTGTLPPPRDWPGPDRPGPDPDGYGTAPAGPGPDAYARAASTSGSPRLLSTARVGAARRTRHFSTWRSLTRRGLTPTRTQG